MSSGLLLLGAGSATVGGGGVPPLDALSNVTGAWSMSRKLLTSYGGGFYTESSGAVTAILDQTGNSRDLGQGSSSLRPLVATAGPNSRASAAFDGTDDQLTKSGVALSTYITNSAGYIIVSAIIDAISTNSATVEANDAIFTDSGNFMGMFLKSGTPSFHAYNWDGNSDSTTHTIALATPYVFEWRHDGGNIMSRVNGGSWQSAASGNTSTMTGALVLGGEVSGGGTNYADMQFFEMATASTVPDETTRDALVANWMAHIGAT